MPEPFGRKLSLSLPRRLIGDLLHFARQVPTIPVQRRMNVALLRAAREQAPARPSWCAIFTKAFAMLSGRKPCGRRVAGVVNAGLDATMGADLLRYLQPAEFSAETSLRIRELNTHGLVSAGTAFLDLTPMTDDVGYAAYIDAVLSDPGVDCLFVAIVPLPASYFFDSTAPGFRCSSQNNRRKP